ncbi:MAG: ABC transporter permease [Lachnospiraceae bacterium]
MLRKLTLRNAKRSAKDYLIYLVTMVIISALMFAFHGMIFSREVREISTDAGIFAALIGLASFFIMIIVIWLVHYMVNFMLVRRSREFGTYLLLGMKKKQIARIFRRENLILGLTAMVIGILPGFVFQKLFVNVFYAIINAEYQITAEFSIWGILVTFGVLVLAYLLALLRIKRRFKKMHVRDFIYMEKQNEQIINENNTWKKVFVIIAVVYIIIFHILAFTSRMTMITVWVYIAGLIAAIYLLYIGLSSFFVNYIKKKHRGVYQGANLFVLRQLASKIKTMRFTMGTLTILFSAALLGCMVVMMFTDFQKKQMEIQMPFDVAVFSDQPDDTFEPQLAVLEENTVLKDYYSYNIHENGTDSVNQYLYTHTDGPERDETVKDGKYAGSTYFGYDTYLGLTDYNRIREMLGYGEVTLKEGHYILHGKQKIDDELEAISETVVVKAGDEPLVCEAVNMEPLSQDGMNGADYIIVVPDNLLDRLKPYYSVMIGELEGEAPSDLQTKLEATQNYLDEFDGYPYAIEKGYGNNQILSFANDVMVADNLKVDNGFAIASMSFMLAYLAIVFLCAALTILAVQQLSDSAKYRFRYEILKKLGLNKSETRKVVLKQLAVYYLCPYLISVVLSMFIGLFASERFVYYTGIQSANFTYYISAVLVFSVVYAAYFITSYVGFVRNLE